jgi:hypothetical protein
VCQPEGLFVDHLMRFAIGDLGPKNSRLFSTLIRRIGDIAGMTNQQMDVTTCYLMAVHVVAIERNRGDGAVN